MRKLWQDDDELFRLARTELYTAVVGDIMDDMGLLDQFLPPGLRPLASNTVVVGRAMPVLGADVPRSAEDSRRNPLLNRPFGLMLEALDDLRPNEVYICSGASPSYALWGEIMSACAQQRGAVGAVVNGYSRDTHGILKLGFPCFSLGCYARDQAPRGKILDFRVPIRFGGVDIRDGDIVVADVDGVCIAPEKAAPDVFTRALTKARGERTVLQAVKSGMGAREAFDTYGIM